MDGVGDEKDALDCIFGERCASGRVNETHGGGKFKKFRFWFWWCRCASMMQSSAFSAEEFEY